LGIELTNTDKWYFENGKTEPLKLRGIVYDKDGNPLDE
jgi:hypothetical protein